MTEYIERGGKLFPTPFSSEEHGDYRQGWNHCLRAIYQQPTADVKPVVRGVKIPRYGVEDWALWCQCSVCGYDALFPEDNFCSHCGADLREENTNER